MPSHKGREIKASSKHRTSKTSKRSAKSPAHARGTVTHDVAGPEHPEIPPVLFAPQPVDLPAWSADTPGVWVERDATTGQVLSLSHPGLPYLAGDASTVTDSELLLIATGYLREANDALGIPDAWLDALAGQPSSGGFSIFPHWTDFDGDPRHSFRAARTDDGGEVIDETALAIAVLCFGIPGTDLFIPLHGGQGLRVAMHVDRVPSDETRPVRVTSVTSSLPPWGDAQLEMASASTEAVVTASGLASGAPAPIDPFFQFLGTIIARLAGLPLFTDFTDFRFRFPSDHGNPIPSPDRLDLTVKTIADSSPDALSYELTVRVPLDGSFENMQVSDRAALVTFATAPAQVFVQDPATRNGPRTFKSTRPNRDSPSLDPSRTNAQLTDVQVTANPKTFLLTDGSFVDVIGSFLDPGSTPGATFVYNSAVPFASRTNTQSAVNAYFHFRGLIVRLKNYGFSLPGYFKFATAPLTVTYRGGVVPGSRDGKTVNAQVRWRISPTATSSAGVGTLDTSLAMADLTLGRRRAPLGIACDPRWLWHEFGHVLLAAATGSLELPFAHSIGDAMSAIVHDPDSALAASPPWRGLTFPWVSIPGRRHDREAKDGWSWSGTFNGRERSFAVVGVSDRRGYWTEQMMSSSLFRMYRALGGDACVINSGGQVVPDLPTRRIAADHAIFLIAHAVQLMGPSTSAPSRTPENFVTAITSADIGISGLVPPPSTAAAVPPRLGGIAHKVARWAFEMQGAYPDPSTPFPNNGPGMAPPVDIYIDSGVPMSRRGGYRPVQFVNNDWHARPSELWVQNAALGFGVDQPPLRNKDNFVFVRVRNRGALDATSVTVTVMAAKVTGAGIPPWPSAMWKPVAVMSTGVGVADVPKSPGATTFGPFKWRPTPGTFALFAVATCAADKANTDPSTGWASAVSPPPQDIALRVACDNNLGLRLVVVP